MRPQLVEVEWVDSCFDFATWTPHEDALEEAKKGPVVCHTTGYLFVDDSEYVVVVSSWSTEEVGAGMTIPREVIREIRALRASSPQSSGAPEDGDRRSPAGKLRRYPCHTGLL